MSELDLFNVDYRGVKFSDEKSAERIISATEEIMSVIKNMENDSKIECINTIKKMLHSMSPMRNEPVDCVIWVKRDSVHANDYNPNSVAPPEMELLRLSIAEDGYTQPIVTFLENSGREVVDGFHRSRVGKECEDIKSRVHGYLPVVTINETQTDKGNRMAATIRHNRARGKHKVEAMSDIVLELKKRNWSDQKIGKHLGMEPDEVLRLAQITGLAEMFIDREFSMAWEADVFEIRNEDE